MNISNPSDEDVERVALALAVDYYNEADYCESHDESGTMDFQDSGEYASQNWRSFISPAKAAIATMQKPQQGGGE